MKKLKIYNRMSVQMRLVIEPEATEHLLEPGTVAEVSSEFIADQDWIDITVHNDLDGPSIGIWATEDLDLTKRLE